MDSNFKQTEAVPPFASVSGYASVLRKSHIEEAFGLAYWALAILAHSAGLPDWCVWPCAFFGCVNWAGSWYYARKEFADEERHNRCIPAPASDSDKDATKTDSEGVQ